MGVTSADSTSRTFSPYILTIDCLVPSSHHLLHAFQRSRSTPMGPWAVKSPLHYLSLQLLTVLILLPNWIWLESSHRKRRSVSHESVSRRAGILFGWFTALCLVPRRVSNTRYVLQKEEDEGHTSLLLRTSKALSAFPDCTASCIRGRPGRSLIL